MADTTAEIYILLTEEKKKTEELEVLNKDLKIENGAMTMEIIELKDQKKELEETVLLLQHKINGYERHNHIHAETHHIHNNLCI